MALFDFFLGIQDGVVGSYRITRATKAPTTSSVAECNMVGELSAPGFETRSVEHYAPFAALEKWPRPGDILPVLFDRKTPEFMKINWKEIPARPYSPPAP